MTEEQIKAIRLAKIVARLGAGICPNCSFVHKFTKDSLLCPSCGWDVRSS